jgi:hypothetical protein
MNNPFNKLCGPSYLYLVVSMIFIVLASFQNMGNHSTYCLGNQECNVTSTTFIFAIKLIYILFWTWILNLMCSTGATNVAWFVVLFPFILMFIAIAMMML